MALAIRLHAPPSREQSAPASAASEPGSTQQRVAQPQHDKQQPHTANARAISAKAARHASTRTSVGSGPSPRSLRIRSRLAWKAQTEHAHDSMHKHACGQLCSPWLPARSVKGNDGLHRARQYGPSMRPWKSAYRPMSPPSTRRRTKYCATHGSAHVPQHQIGRREGAASIETAQPPESGPGGKQKTRGKAHGEAAQPATAPSSSSTGIARSTAPSKKSNADDAQPPHAALGQQPPSGQTTLASGQPSRTSGQRPAGQGQPCCSIVSTDGSSGPSFSMLAAKWKRWRRRSACLGGDAGGPGRRRPRGARAAVAGGVRRPGSRVWPPRWGARAAWPSRRPVWSTCAATRFMAACRCSTGSRRFARPRRA